jgi:hypothetical protein
MVGALLVPGLGFYLSGKKRRGFAALVAAVVLLLLFFVCMGYLMGNLAFGWLLSLHATAFIYYCGPYLVEESLQTRLGFTLIVLVSLGLCIYWPARNFIQSHCFMPLRVNGHVVVVGRNYSTHGIHRGDWVGYNLEGNTRGMAHGGEGQINVYSGMGLGPVLAVPGDQVEFSTNAFTINGVSHPHLPQMPVSGSFVVPDDHFFIWSRFEINSHGNVNPALISATMLDMSIVDEKQVVGRPFKRWFGRKQILS